jgi:transcriptional regulator with XRE-family HTH domain
MPMANIARASRPSAAENGHRPKRTPVPILEAETYVGVNVKRLRQGRGWSQQQLVSAVNRQLPIGFGARPWQQPTMAKIESTKNRRSVTVDEALALARALDVPLHELTLQPSAAADAETQRLWADYVAAMDAAADAVRRRVELQRALQDRGVDVDAAVDAWITDVTGRLPAEIAQDEAATATAAPRRRKGQAT